MRNSMPSLAKASSLYCLNAGNYYIVLFIKTENQKFSEFSSTLWTMVVPLMVDSDPSKEPQAIRSVVYSLC